MTTVSWFYDQTAPKQPVPLATSSTYYGSSSLASSSKNELVVDSYQKDSLFTTQKMTNGVSGTNSTIYNTDKPVLGIQEALTYKEHYQKNNPYLRQTVPNVNVLKSKYTLHDMNSRPTALM
jgi:hypothetical protein